LRRFEQDGAEEIVPVAKPCRKISIQARLRKFRVR
jgi:hypothetical protein